MQLSWERKRLDGQKLPMKTNEKPPPGPGDTGRQFN